MSSPNPQAPLTGGYDQSLLAAAPAASRAAKQEGYNVDLLDEGRHNSMPPTRAADLEAARGGSKENFRSPVERGPAAAMAPGKVPFWRTRRGIIGISVLAVVIVGAVVGGAVGGSVGKKNNTNSQAAIPTSSNGTESAPPIQGQGPATSSTSVTGASPAPQTQQAGPASGSATSGSTSTTTAGPTLTPGAPGQLTPAETLPNPDSQKSAASEGGPGGLPDPSPTPNSSGPVQNMQ